MGAHGQPQPPQQQRVNLTFLRSMRMLRFFSVFHFDRYTKGVKRLSRVLVIKQVLAIPLACPCVLPQKTQ